MYAKIKSGILIAICLDVVCITLLIPGSFLFIRRLYGKINDIRSRINMWKFIMTE